MSDYLQMKIAVTIGLRRHYSIKKTFFNFFTYGLHVQEIFNYQAKYQAD